MESYAIVQASGKQFWVEENKFYDFDKLPLDKGDMFNLNQIKEFIGKDLLVQMNIEKDKLLERIDGLEKNIKSNR